MAIQGTISTESHNPCPWSIMKTTNQEVIFPPFISYLKIYKIFASFCIISKKLKTNRVLIKF